MINFKAMVMDQNLSSSSSTHINWNKILSKTAVCMKDAEWKRCSEIRFTFEEVDNSIFQTKIKYETEHLKTEQPTIIKL